MTKHKRCKDCLEWKLPEEFPVNRARPDGRHYYCKVCQNTRGQRWRAENPEAFKTAMAKRNANRRRSWMLRTYGITLEEYESLLVEQDGKCPICLNGLVRPSVDHCHDTGAIRGILCRHCNSSLSVFEKDPKAIVRLAAYLGITNHAALSKAR